MKIDNITPLVLTWNEEPNIGRCLERLTWAREVIVMDSGSTDRTLEICQGFPNVRVVYRRFDSFAGQCNAGLKEISGEWALSLDADYLVLEGFAKKLAELDGEADGYRLPFRYCVYGKPLRSCLYPPRVCLYRKSKSCYHDDGHGHKVRIDGLVADAHLPIDHDDRKPLPRWLESQRKYALLEAGKLLSSSEPEGLPDRLRRMIWPAAPAAFFYTLVVKRVIFDGWAGWLYVLQRTYAELLLSLALLERKLTGSAGLADGAAATRVSPARPLVPADRGW